MNKEASTKALTTKTGAGQWGSVLAMACSFFDMALEVYMVKVSYFQKPYRRIILENFGATVFASTSNNIHYGSDILAEDPDSPGSLGMAISEAVEAAASSGGTKKYSLGSVLNHVLMHQTVIGIESLKQMEMAGEYLGLASARDETVAASPDCPAAICTQTQMLPFPVLFPVPHRYFIVYRPCFKPLFPLFPVFPVFRGRPPSRLVMACHRRSAGFSQREHSSLGAG